MRVSIGGIVLRVVLAASVAALCVSLWQQINVPVEVSPIADERAQAAPAPAVAVRPDPPQILALTDLAATRERPLFSPTRKPADARPATVDVPSEAAGSTDGLALVGMMRGRMGGGRALIRVAGQPNAAWVRVGSEVDGWVLQDIRKGSVILQRGNQTAELQLYPAATAAVD